MTVSHDSLPDNLSAVSSHQSKAVSRVQGAWGDTTFSRLVFGAWRLADREDGSSARVAKLLQSCLELGITTFDHADIYGGYRCEALFGAALAELGPRQRSSYELVSKCGIKLVSPNRPGHAIKSYDTSASHIQTSVETSLRNLRTEYLDLLLIHRPDPLMSADEIAAVFAKLQSQGKVRHFGVSNFTPAQFELLAARTALVTNQIEFSPLHLAPLTDGTLDQCQRLQLPPMIWSPLAGGRLFTGDGERELRIREALQIVAGDFAGATTQQIAFAWILRHPARPMPIIGTNAPERLAALAKAEQFVLSREQWHRIWSAAMGTSVP